MNSDELHIKKVSESEVEMSGADYEMVHSVEKGVMEDDLDIKTITFWSFATVLFMLALILGGYQIYKYWGFQSRNQQAINTEYKDLSQKRAADANRLSSYGVINPDSGYYHIPIEAAIDVHLKEVNPQQP